MKSTREKIGVMQAFADGKTIQRILKNVERAIWLDCGVEPAWDWLHCDYRIKPEPTYRPYKSVEELVEDFKARFHVDNPPYTMPLIWVKRKLDKTILLYCFFYSETQILRKDFDNFTYLDGTPFGKLVEE